MPTEAQVAPTSTVATPATPRPTTVPPMAAPIPVTTLSNSTNTTGVGGEILAAFAVNNQDENGEDGEDSEDDSSDVKENDKDERGERIAGKGRGIGVRGFDDDHEGGW